MQRHRLKHTRQGFTTFLHYEPGLILSFDSCPEHVSLRQEITKNITVMSLLFVSMT